MGRKFGANKLINKDANITLLFMEIAIHDSVKVYAKSNKLYIELFFRT